MARISRNANVRMKVFLACACVVLAVMWMQWSPELSAIANVGYTVNHQIGYGEPGAQIDDLDLERFGVGGDGNPGLPGRAHF